MLNWIKKVTKHNLIGSTVLDVKSKVEYIQYIAAQGVLLGKPILLKNKPDINGLTAIQVSIYDMYDGSLCCSIKIFE